MSNVGIVSDSVIRISEVKTITGLSRSTIYDHIKKGLFPQSIKLGPRSVGWLRSEIEGWLNACAANRNSGGKGKK